MHRAAPEAETAADIMRNASTPNETKGLSNSRTQTLLCRRSWRIHLFHVLIRSPAADVDVVPPPFVHTATTASPNRAVTSPSSEGSPTLGPAPPARRTVQETQPRVRGTRCWAGRGRQEKAKEARAERPERAQAPPPQLRTKFREERPKLSYRELLPNIAKAWQNLDPGEKQRYQDIVDRGKAVYTVQKKAYDMIHGGFPNHDHLDRSPTNYHSPHAFREPPPPFAVGSLERRRSEEEESEKEESEDDQRRVHPQHAHGVPARHYHHAQDEEDEDEEEEDEEVEEPPMKKNKTQQQLALPPIATV
ncbi:hypothetical protein FS837_001146 [Tulasnella sp. UAMH 9824]|nr:hypothetical protein FS837_001146 [Tulasnella sp. UAMH 9824]